MIDKRRYVIRCMTPILLMAAMANSIYAADFSDDFTDDAFTQSHWTFFSPWECINHSPPFAASATASGGILCLNSPTAALDQGLPTVAVGYVNQPFDTLDVSIFAGVSFTAAELNGPARIVKTIMLRFDPREVPFLQAFGCPASPDGGDFYYIDMDPHSGGTNRFSIVKYVHGDQTLPVVGGPTYNWPADVQHNVYFGCSWDAGLQTNRLRAILYLNDIHNPIIDLQVHDNSIKPGNLDPSNNGNSYVGLLVSNDSGGSVNNVCMTVPSQTACSLGINSFVVKTISIDLDVDTDADGVPDPCDQCPGTIPGSSTDAEGCPPNVPGDFDRDGDVDGDDLALLTSCQSGPGLPVQSPSCGKTDLDHDQDVDQDDFGIFQRCFSGSGHPVDANCGNQH